MEDAIVGQRVGYTRVSSLDQNLDRQLDGIHLDETFADSASAKDARCPPMANLLLSVVGAYAEFERAPDPQRQREGIALAKLRGAYRGRKMSLATDQVAELTRRTDAGESKSALAREFNVSRETGYQYLRAANR